MDRGKVVDSELLFSRMTASEFDSPVFTSLEQPHTKKLSLGYSGVGHKLIFIVLNFVDEKTLSNKT